MIIDAESRKTKIAVKAKCVQFLLHMSRECLEFQRQSNQVLVISVLGYDLAIKPNGIVDGFDRVITDLGPTLTAIWDARMTSPDLGHPGVNHFLLTFTLRRQ